VEAVKAAYDCVGVHGSIVLAPVRTAAHQGADMLRPLETAVGLALPIFQLTFFHWSWSVRLCGGPCLQPTRTWTNPCRLQVMDVLHVRWRNTPWWHLRQWRIKPTEKNEGRVVIRLVYTSWSNPRFHATCNPRQKTLREQIRNATQDTWPNVQKGELTAA